MKQITRCVLGVILLISSILVTSLFFISKKVQAANLTEISVTLSRLKVSVPADQTIEFVTPTGVDGPTKTIELTYSGAQSFGMSGVVFSDIDLRVDSTGNCSSFTDKTLAGTAGSATWGVAVNNSTGTITFTPPTNATSNEIPAGSCVRILIGKNATGGTNQITNPSSADPYMVAISGVFGDRGTAAVRIITDDQIVITAEINPTLSVVISSNTCSLGVLSAELIKTCSYTVTVSTNAVSGYTSTILADGKLRNTTYELTDASGGTVIKGTEEYGIGTSKSGQSVIQNTACTNNDTSSSQPASSITTSAQQFANSAGPVHEDLTTMCHLASVSGVSPAGLYSQIATVVVTAKF